MNAHSLIALALVAACSSESSNPSPDSVDAGNHAMPDAAPQADAPSQPAGAKVFITSDFYTGDLKTAGHGADGLASADALCQLHADAASLPGVFRAWLSTSTVDAVDHIAGAGPWFNTHGEMVFANRAQLQTHGVISIGYDESGDQTGPLAWTGTANGRKAPSEYSWETTSSCNDWTSNSAAIASAAIGDGGTQSSSSWTSYGYDSCYKTHALYCFQIVP